MGSEFNFAMRCCALSSSFFSVRLVAFCRRKSVLQLRSPCRTRTMASAINEKSDLNRKRIDSHLHVWASPEEANDFPYLPGKEPTVLGSTSHLLENMAKAGVDGALIIQSSTHKFDHSYVSRALQMYPGNFIGCCLADPTPGGGGVKEIERLIKEGYRAVRFNPYLWPAGENMTNDVGRAMFSKAGELGVPVGFMCFEGLLLHIEDIEKLCLEFPQTTVMMDHFGFCKPPETDEEAKAWKLLLGLARFPKVYVKISAHFRISRQQFPYEDSWPLIRELLNTFGVERLLWGSDFPFITEECGYVKFHQELPRLIGDSLQLSDSELDLLLGGTALKLFDGAWQESKPVASLSS